jgi:hypothetical protein
MSQTFSTTGKHNHGDVFLLPTDEQSTPEKRGKPKPKMRPMSSFEQRILKLGAADDEEQEKNVGFQANDQFLRKKKEEEEREAQSHLKAKHMDDPPSSYSDHSSHRPKDQRKLEEDWVERQKIEEESFQQQIQTTLSNRYHVEQTFLQEHGIQFKISLKYDYQKSTEENYATAAPNGGKSVAPTNHKHKSVFVGKYQAHRQQLDHSFHRYYQHDRQLLQDKIIDSMLQKVGLVDTETYFLESKLENWIVFTVGTMGAGKAHTMKWLAANGLFPLESFIHIDPNEIRKFLPETAEYNLLDDHCTATLTQKEIAYIAEVKSTTSMCLTLPNSILILLFIDSDVSCSRETSQCPG